MQPPRIRADGEGEEERETKMKACSSHAAMMQSCDECDSGDAANDALRAELAAARAVVEHARTLFARVDKELLPSIWEQTQLRRVLAEYDALAKGEE